VYLTVSQLRLRHALARGRAPSSLTMTRVFHTLITRPPVLLQGAGAADASWALRRQGAPQSELRRPAVLRPLVALVAVSGHSATARLAAKLLRGIAEAGPDCCDAIRWAHPPARTSAVA
jgi:hypothetical protein